MAAPAGPRSRVLIGVGAALAAVAIAAAVVVAVAKRDRGPAGPDPFAGAYPVLGASATATPAYTWQPTGPPAGPLKRFTGRATRVTGTIVDRRSGLTYAKLAQPWKPTPGLSHSAGIEWTVQKPHFHWWAGAYSDLLDSDLVPATKGPDGLRAAAELDAAKWAKTYEGTLIPAAGQPLRVSGRRAWLAGYRVRTPEAFDHIPERALVVVVVNSGRRVPALFEVSVAKPKYRLLPDINTLVGSLRVVR
ncbi:MAG TPA: hypothetical protein VF069_14710 [Streptosporangiaceae bacterium]